MFLCEDCHNNIHKGIIAQSTIDKIIKEKSYDISLPKNYIKSENYKNKSQYKKLQYLCTCFKDHKHITNEEREIIIIAMENIILKKDEV